MEASRRVRHTGRCNLRYGWAASLPVFGKGARPGRTCSLRRAADKNKGPGPRRRIEASCGSCRTSDRTSEERPMPILPARAGLAAAVALAGLLSPVARVAPATAAPVLDKPCVGGFAGKFPCRLVDLKAHLPLADVGGGWASDIWGWVDPQTKRE